MIRLNSIFVKLFFTFVAVLLPLYIFSVMVFAWSENVVKDEIRQSNVSNLEYLKNSLKESIESSNNLQYALTNDLEIRAISVTAEEMPKYEFYTLVNKITRSLSVVKDSHPLVEEAIIHLPEANIRISSNHGLMAYDSERLHAMISKYEAYPAPVIFNELSIYTAIPFPIRRSYEEKLPRFMTEIQLSRKELLNYINQFETKYKSQVVLYDHNNEFFFRDDNSEKENDQAIELLMTADIKDQFDWMGETSETFEVELDGIKYLFISQYSDDLNISLISVILLEDVFSVADTFGMYLLIFTAIAFVVVVVYVFITYRSVISPINIILKAFSKLEEGQMDIRIHSKSSYEFERLDQGFNKMVDRLNQMINKMYVQEIHKNRAQLKQLQTQINPHFLYNSHFILHRMIIDNDVESAAIFSSYLGDYYKYVTRNGKDEVKLGVEVQHLGKYAAIQEIRFSGRLEISMGDLPEAYKECVVPRMILQPVLENAIEYGAKNQHGEFAHITIQYEADPEGLTISIEDDGKNLSNEKLSELQEKLNSTSDDLEVTGMLNIHRRLRIMYGNDCGLNLSRSNLGGLCVRVRIVSDSKR